MTGGPTEPTDRGPVLDYHKPDPERHTRQWFAAGLLLGGATVMGGVVFAILWAYTAQSGWPYAVVAVGGILFLGGLTALLRPGRRRPFGQGVLTGCLIGAAIEGLCIVAGGG